MSPETVFSCVALVISMMTFLWTVLVYRRESRASAVASCFGLMAQAESMLRDVPGALKFHGITERELSQAGITAQEFAYLLVNFTSASVYYRMHEHDDPSPFATGSYRYVMLESEATRRAWPLLRRLINPDIGAYGKKITATLAKIERDLAGDDENDTTDA